MAPPRGRPPLSRGVFSFDDVAVPLPGEVVLDTSFVVSALIGSQPLHARCAEYLAQLAEGGTRVAFNRLLVLELEEAVFKIALKERYGRDWMRRRHDGRALPRAARLGADVLGAWKGTLESFVWLELSLEDVDGAVPRLMARYGLGSYDAVHAATAMATDFRKIVTTDAGFAHVPESELTLYVDGTRVRSCRERRVPTRRNR